MIVVLQNILHQILAINIKISDNKFMDTSHFSQRTGLRNVSDLLVQN